MAFIHSSQLIWNECGYPRWSVCFTMPNAIFFYFLFNNFYQKSYKGSDAAKIEKAKQKALNDNNNNDSNNNENSKDKDLNKKQS